jgi:hypothetical protein
MTISEPRRNAHRTNSEFRTEPATAESTNIFRLSPLYL